MSSGSSKLAPLNKRVYLVGTFRDYRVVLKDNSGLVLIASIDVPTAAIGHATVRAIRELATKRGGHFF